MVCDERYAIEENENTVFIVDNLNSIIYKEFIDICDLLNEKEEELNRLKQQISSLKVELHTHKHPLWSTREAERKVSELTDLLSNETKKNAILLQEINSLRKENMRLKEVQKYG